MVDKTNTKILRLLQKDARIPISEIARAVGITENAIKYRILKLEKEGYITRYGIMLNPSKFGKETIAIFNINVKLEEIKESLEELGKIDEIIKIYRTTGHYSINAIGIFEDKLDLQKFLDERLSKMLNVKDCDVLIVLEKVKDSIFMI